MTGATYAGDAGAGGVRAADGVLADVPGLGPGLTCRWPSDRAPLGLVLFCHGLGASARGYAALSHHWARHGYLVIHPTFADSVNLVARDRPGLGVDPQADLSGWTDMPALRAAMFEILHDPAHWVARVDTVRRVLDRLEDVVSATCGPLPRPLPAAIAGHSFGAYTAQLLAGAEIDLPDNTVGRFRDDRFRAAILLSAQGREQQGLRHGSWDAMHGPVLTVTGTLDRGAKGGDWRWKSEPYALSPAGGKYLVVLENGDHYLGGFADTGLQPQVPAQQEAVRQLTLAFLDAHLRDDPAARAWLGSVETRVADAALAFRHK